MSSKVYLGSINDLLLDMEEGEMLSIEESILIADYVRELEEYIYHLKGHLTDGMDIRYRVESKWIKLEALNPPDLDSNGY